MKVEFYVDEWYPVFTLEPILGKRVSHSKVKTIPDELYEEYSKTLKEFLEVQAKLEKYE